MTMTIRRPDCAVWLFDDVRRDARRQRAASAASAGRACDTSSKVAIACGFSRSRSAKSAAFSPAIGCRPCPRRRRRPGRDRRGPGTSAAVAAPAEHRRERRGRQRFGHDLWHEIRRSGAINRIPLNSGRLYERHCSRHARQLDDVVVGADVPFGVRGEQHARSGSAASAIAGRARLTAVDADLRIRARDAA